MSCEFCGRRADHVCNTCGRNVCSTHYKQGLCTACAETICRLCGKNLAVTHCPLCARPVCTECLVEVTVVVRLCRECYTRLGAPKEWPPQPMRPDIERVAARLGLLVHRALAVARKPAG